MNSGSQMPPGAVLRHIALFVLYDEYGAQEVIDEALHLMAAMCDCEHVLHYEIAHSLDTRKGNVLVELIDFPNKEALDLFKKTMAHQMFAEFIRQRADWTIGDYFPA